MKGSVILRGCLTESTVPRVSGAGTKKPCCRARLLKCFSLYVNQAMLGGNRSQLSRAINVKLLFYIGYVKFDGALSNS